METIVFTYGRMNPLHVGHLILITAIKTLKSIRVKKDH